MTTPQKKKELREEHDRLMSAFMENTEMERLKILRSWKFWEDAAGLAKDVFERIQESGLEGVTDADMAALFMAEYKRVGQRPSVRARALSEIGKMRVQHFRDDAQKARAEMREVRSLLKKQEKAHAKEIKKLEAERERLTVRFDAEVEKARMEERRRLEEVEGSLD